MSEDQANSAGTGDNINQEGSFGVGVNQGTINVHNSPAENQPEQPPPQNIPLSGVSEFVGRTAELEELHANLQHNERVAISAVAGMGGVGKTELAIQYAQHHYQQGNYPGSICWLRAREADLGIQIVQYAQGKLNISIPAGLDLPTQVDYCWRNWRSGQTLVVLDDVNDYEQVKLARIPTEKRFQVLITTRQRFGSPVVRLDLDVLSPEAALQLLKSLVGEERITAELATAQQLCQWLGYLPLALELVGRYLAEEEDLSLEEIYQQLQEYRLGDESLAQAPTEATAEREVAAAFDLTWRRFVNEPYVQELALVISLFAPTPVPWWLVKELYQEEPNPYTKEARRKLVKFNLIKRVAKETYQMHQLIREFVHVEGEHLRGQLWKERFCKLTVKWEQKIPQTPTQKVIAEIAPIMPHIAEAATTWQDWLTDEDLIYPFLVNGRFYEGQGAYKQAESWNKQCLLATRERLGDEHPLVATSLNNLAGLYRAMGRYEQAKPLYHQALEMRKQLLGEKHPDVAESLNNLAELYYAMGRYEQAEPLSRQALEMGKRLLGDEHPDVATSLNNLAVLYKSMGKYEQAEPLHRQALKMRKRLLGDEHPDVATSLNNLALLYTSMGSYEQAEPLHRQALEIIKRLLGDEHPLVATSLNNLAVFYNEMGKYEQAEPLSRQALDMYKRLLGSEHPSVATSLNNLAVLYTSMGRYEQAEPLYHQALEMRKRLLGDEHPHTKTFWNNFVLFLQEVVNEGRENELSDNPMVQQLLNEFRSEDSINTHEDQ